MSIINATVAPVPIGDKINVEGLRTDCGKFAVSVQQAAELFQVRPDNAQRDFKRLLGECCRFVQISIKNARSRKPEKCLWLDDFAKLHRKLDKKGNVVAELIGDALLNMSWGQLFADAFDIEVTKQQRQKTLNRILDEANAWEKFYDDDWMNAVAKMLNTSRHGSIKMANFFWKAVYDFLTPIEKAKLNKLNPVVNGRRKQCIHQFLDTETKERLAPKVYQLFVSVKHSRNECHFWENWNVGQGQIQLNIFDA